MGKATRPAEVYRDDPDAVSMHTTPDDYTYDDAPEISGMPPSYTDSEVENSSFASAPPIRHVPPPTTKTNHNSPKFKSGQPVVHETTTHMNAELDSDPVKFEKAIRDVATLPPTPYIYIMGTHKETVKRGDKKETHHVTDFRIVINIQHYIYNNEHSEPTGIVTPWNAEKTYRGSILKCRGPNAKQDIEVGDEQRSLTEWCHLYCASPRMLRIFRLQRTVPGLDEQYLRNRIEGLIASANYRGNVSISFPIEDRNVDFYTSNKINEWRLKTWIRWVFYLTFLWIFTWPYLFFMTRRYTVVKAQWPFSSVGANNSKIYTTISEEQWFERWHVAVRRLVLDRYQGEASEEVMRGVAARPEDPPMPGTINTGHEGIDTAMGVLTQGFQVARAIQGGGNLGRGLQGGWGYDT
ncbi:hypothetical protein DE146DRAFT_476410 [Phaeosphaeria sp. MPI-PUGE-AT-0046c]|nr:hypothetical protein DE146DRAFT_476410 [Phaeosphaeria sp. MPI-PUGE-AT-0046c]